MEKEITKLEQNTQPVKFLTIEEFAKRIGVHPQTVRVWDKNGLLQAHHKSPSGRRFYTEEQVIEYLAQRSLQETFLTVEEFAKRIGVHPQTVRTWDKNGLLPAHYKSPSGRKFYTEEQVKNYLMSK